MKVAGIEVDIHRRRLMGTGSFWLEAVRGDHRVDIYFEPINGWRRHTFRPGAVLIGPLLVIVQNWRRRKALREIEESARRREIERRRGAAAGFPPEVDRLGAAIAGRQLILAEVRAGDGDPSELARRLSDAERELEAATSAYEKLVPTAPKDRR